MSYIVGQTAVLSVSVVDGDGSPLDPTTLTLYVETPSGDVETYVYGDDAEVVRESAGEYLVDYVLAEGGVYFWRWDTDGNVEDADEGYIFVRRSRFDLG